MALFLECAGLDGALDLPVRSWRLAEEITTY